MHPLFLAVILLSSILPVRAFADSLSCENGIVSSGESVAVLLIRCGEPDWKEAHDEEIVDSIEKDVKRKTIISVERWTYNFGPDRFMRNVTIRNGVVAAIATGGYGTAKDRVPPVEPGCGDRIISIGDTKADVRNKCGEPFSRNAHQEEIRERHDTGSLTVIVTVEEWTYNFGPDRFMRVITFRNGVVSDIDTGSYGR